MLLYDTNNANSNRTFSGEVNTEVKGTILLFDEWNSDDFNTEIPVGINMLLFRNIEEFIGVAKTSRTAKYIKS